jgi:hypothetical protein
MTTSWTMLAPKGNQETGHLNPNWWHELSTILLGKLQGKNSFSVIDFIEIYGMFWGSVSACSLTTASFVQPEE